MEVAGKEASSRPSEGPSSHFIDETISAREMTEMEDALRSCTEQLLLVREEKERLIFEAANKISSEQKKSRDLLHKLEAANKRFAKVATENYNLQNTVNSKDKLIRELNGSKAHSERRLTEATAKLEFMQKQCASLQYEARMVQKELEIRIKERDYDLQSIHAAQKQQQESAHKITTLESECQRLRTMVQNRLPGPAALVKMKEEVERLGTSSAENGTRRTRASTAVQPPLRAATRRHSVSEGYLVKLQEMDDENSHLRQLLARKENEIKSVQLQYADEACSVVQRQLKELWSDNDLEQSNNSDQFANPLVSKPEQLRTGKKQTSLSQSRRIAVTDMQLLVDLTEIEKLEMESRPSSAPYQGGTDASDTHSEMVLSEIVGIDQISEDGSFDKYPQCITTEMDSGTRQEMQKEPIGATEGQNPGDIPETRSQVQFSTCKIDEELLARQEQNDNCQERQSVYFEAESAAADGSMKNLPEVRGKQPTTNLAISAAAEKLAECQETMTNISKRLQALQTPSNADALGKEKPSVPKARAEEDAKPDDFSSPSSEEVARKKQQGGTKKDHKGNICLRQAVVSPMIPRSPRPSFSADMKKKRRASLLSRLVFRKKA